MEALYLLWKREGIIRIKGLAEMLNVKPPSIVEYLNKLAKKGLVKYVRHETITLTDEGIRAAEGIYRRHKALKEFLTTLLRIPDDVAEDDACSIEHELHDITVNRIIKLMNYFKERPEKLSQFLSIIDNAYKENC